MGTTNKEASDGRSNGSVGGVEWAMQPDGPVKYGVGSTMEDRGWMMATGGQEVPANTGEGEGGGLGLRGGAKGGGGGGD